MFKHTSTLARWSLTLAAAAALSACGGGGGDPDDTELPPPSPPPPAAKSVTDLQGRWTGTVGTQAAAAMNLGDGTSWVVEYDAQDAPVAVTQGAWAVVDDAYTGSG